MPQGTSAAQVQAYRFGTRRLAHALEHGSAQLVPFGGPRRGLALLMSAVLAGLVLAGFAVYGLIKPAPSIGSAKVLVDADQGGAYVVHDGVVHPALNIASALLAAVDGSGTGSGGAVRQVNAETLASMPRGELVGIPGAPSAVPSADQLLASSWLVCDDAAPDPAAAPGTAVHPQTTILLGQDLLGSSPGPALLVTADAKTYFLVWAGHRSRVGLRGADDAVAATLGLDLHQARTVSLALLDSIPEQPALTTPAVPGAGTATTVGGAAAKVGDIVRVPSSSGEQALRLVLTDGLQPVSAVFADLVRAGTRQGAITTMTPGQVAAAGVTSHPLDTSAYPSTRPDVVDLATQPVLCSGWSASGTTIRQSLATAASLPLPAGARAVPVPPSQRNDHVVDRVYLAPGRGLVVNQSVDGRIAGTGNLFFVNDQGVRYPVPTKNALDALGLGAHVGQAPSHLLALLPMGPSLDPAAARSFVPEEPGAATSATP